MNLTALHPYLRTKKDATELTLFLEKIIDGFFNEKFSFENIAESEIPYDLKRLLEKLLTESGIKIDEKATQGEFFKKLKETITDLPVVHMILAFSPKEDLVKTIHDWFYQNYKKTVLLEISTDESLIGGMVISFEGRANDYSIKNQIGQIA